MLDHFKSLHCKAKDKIKTLKHRKTNILKLWAIWPSLVTGDGKYNFILE